MDLYIISSNVEEFATKYICIDQLDILKHEEEKYEDLFWRKGNNSLNIKSGMIKVVSMYNSSRGWSLLSNVKKCQQSNSQTDRRRV